MDMIERVAKALSQQLDKDGYYVDAARAAIEEMREPTEAMVEASAAIYGDDWRNRHEYSKDQWRAMVDAALKEHEGEKR